MEQYKLTRKDKIIAYSTLIIMVVVVFILGGWFGFSNGEKSAQKEHIEYLKSNQRWVKSAPTFDVEVQRKAMVDSMNIFYVIEKEKQK